MCYYEYTRKVGAMSQYHEGDWITIKGRHVLIGADGKIPDFNEDTKEKQLAKAEEQKKELNKQKADENSDKSVQLVSVNPKDFSKAIADAKKTGDKKDIWRVDAHDAKDYSDRHCKCLVTKGGSTVAVDKDGDIISVCKGGNESTHGIGSKLLDKAVKAGGVKLDSFAGNHSFYTKNGFEPVSWTPFSVEYAPEGWKESGAGQEPVIFYRYVGKDKVKYSGKEGLSKFLSDNKPYTGDDGYDNAKAFRDSKIKRR